MSFHTQCREDTNFPLTSCAVSLGALRSHAQYLVSGVPWVARRPPGEHRGSRVVPIGGRLLFRGLSTCTHSKSHLGLSSSSHGERGLEDLLGWGWKAPYSGSLGDGRYELPKECLSALYACPRFPPPPAQHLPCAPSQAWTPSAANLPPPSYIPQILQTWLGWGPRNCPVLTRPGWLLVQSPTVLCGMRRSWDAKSVGIS